MKKTIALLLMVTALPLYADDCMKNAMTNGEMIRCSGLSLNKEEAQLEKVYQTLIKKHNYDKAYIAKLKASHKAWLTYRDAQVDLYYPENNYQGYYMCTNNLKEALTHQRINQLKRDLLVFREGDICQAQ